MQRLRLPVLRLGRVRALRLRPLCTDAHLRAAGFTDAEIEVYHPEAVVVLHGRPSPLRTIPIGRLKANTMVRTAHAIRRRIGEGANA